MITSPPSSSIVLRFEQTKTRLEAFRTYLQTQNLAGWLLPKADIFQGEYLPESENGLAWLTGFTGSAGFVIVLQHRAALFVDGRYTIQAAEELPLDAIEIVPMADQKPEEWLSIALIQENIKRVGYDPALFNLHGFKRFEAMAMREGVELVPSPQDPFEVVWQNRPTAPRSEVYDHPLLFAGEESVSKIARLQEKLKEDGADALVVSDNPSLNWLLNIRASDVQHLPILRAFGLVPQQGRVLLFVDPARLSPEVAERLAPYVEVIAPLHLPFDGRHELIEALRDWVENGKNIHFDEESAAILFSQALCGGKQTARIEWVTNPIEAMKARKNAVECAGARAAHQKDGLAMVRFLAWLEAAWKRGERISEIRASNQLATFRRENSAFMDLSFTTISASGAHAALPHYHATPESDVPIEAGLFLIDSGGQYKEGTTDITRTLAMGQPNRAMCEAYTLVLKGMIAVSTLIFPEKTLGREIDPFARHYLWRHGKNYDHGTGHGVGSYLSVHEGPQRLARSGACALESGMILSNEPGYYEQGAFGVRIENLLLVEARKIEGSPRAMLGFETLTLCPIDTRPLIRGWLTQEERDWLNAYHKRVFLSLASGLTGADLDYLERACQMML